MRDRFLTSIAVVAVLSLSVLPVAGQAPTDAAKATPKPSAKPKSPMARTPDGHPDLQGTWNIPFITPLERPAQLAGKETLSDEEAAAAEEAEIARAQRLAEPSRPDRAAPPVGGDTSVPRTFTEVLDRAGGGTVGGYNYFWIDRGTNNIVVNGQRRTSLIVDPPDGHVPALTPEAQRRGAGRVAFAGRPTSDAAENVATEAPGEFDNPENRPLAERCLLGFGSTSGPPTLPNYFYNNLKQIVQTPDAVMILVEMVHDARVIRMNQPHLPPQIRKWMGDSVGHWEGDTLVVDTTNFTDKTRFRGSSENLHVVERFARLDADTILYRFTVDDPRTWVRPWTGEYPWVTSDDLIYEYACHEANYALGDILRGARLQDQEATAAGKK